MDTAILVDDLDRVALSFVNKLNEEHFNFTIAALMKNQDAEDWYVVLGIPELQKKGSRLFFEQIYNLIKEGNLNLSLSEIKLMDDEGATFSLLRKRFKPSADTFRVPFKGNYIYGVRFPDSIIYSVK